MKEYKIATSSQDPTLSLKLPTEILRDLAIRAEENGRSITIEIAMRLARSLERDQEMLDEDNELALKAFAKIESFLK